MRLHIAVTHVVSEEVDDIGPDWCGDGEGRDGAEQRREEGKAELHRSRGAKSRGRGLVDRDEAIAGVAPFQRQFQCVEREAHGLAVVGEKRFGRGETLDDL